MLRSPSLAALPPSSDHAGLSLLVLTAGHLWEPKGPTPIPTSQPIHPGHPAGDWLERKGQLQPGL